jgi:hypothetical protein
VGGRPRWGPSPLPPSERGEEDDDEEEEAKPGLMRCSKMAMRRNMETSTAVAAKPKEMALALVDPSAAAPLMDEAAAASSLALPATLSPAAGSDGVPTPAIPTHGLDLCPATKLLMAAASLPPRRGP